jgi:ATP adenylyltransferase
MEVRGLSGWPKPWFDVLWAPWRMKYIREAVKKHEDKGKCVFCEALKKNDEESLIIYRSRHSFIIMNKYPYNTGHVMVVPKRHVSSLEALTGEELLDLSLLTKAAIRGLREALNPHGFNIGINIGRTAGAGIDAHIHVHIVPRWDGDTNFMLVTASTKVIPQDVRETYREIKDYIVAEARKLFEDR